MSDVSGVPATAAPLNATWRIVFAVMTLVFNAGVVWWVLLYGKSDNLLHQNALSWSYILSAIVLAGIGFSSAMPYISVMLGAKK